MNIWALIMGAGQGTRLKEALPGVSKQFAVWKGLPLFWHSALALAASPEVRGLILALPEADFSKHSQLAEECAAASPPGLPWRAVPGGETRRDSVWNALAALPPECTHVLVHDAARPFVRPALTQRVLDALRQGHAAVIPGFTPADTIKEVDENGLVLRTPARSGLRAVQTPQGFALPLLRLAHQKARQAGLNATDDAALLESCGHPVLLVQGDESNKKITVPADLDFLKEGAMPETNSTSFPCTGFGYDVHAYGGDRPLVLGGVPINSGSFTVKAHSDGDVLLHALIDALLGAACAGDIGALFPDSDPAFAGANSAVLLAETLDLVRRKGFTPCHADLTIVAQAPKIAPFRKEISKNIAHLLHLDEDCVNVKASTEEGLGFTGAKEGLKAMAVVSGLRRRPGL